MPQYTHTGAHSDLAAHVAELGNQGWRLHTVLFNGTITLQFFWERD